LLCREVTCCNVEHARAINTYANNITAACITAAELTVPQSCTLLKRKTPQVVLRVTLFCPVFYHTYVLHGEAGEAL